MKAENKECNQEYYLNVRRLICNSRFTDIRDQKLLRGREGTWTLKKIKD